MRKINSDDTKTGGLAIFLIVLTAIMLMSSAYAFLNVNLAVDGIAKIQESATCSGDLTATVRFESPWNNDGKLRTIANFTVSNNSNQPIDDWFIHVVGTSDMVITMYNNSGAYQANASGVIDVEPYDYNQVIQANSEITFGFIIDSVGDPIMIRSISIGSCELVSKVGIYSDGTITGVEMPDVELTGLSITPNSTQMVVGDSLSFSYTKTPSNAANSITWSTSDSSIVSIDNNGYATAVGVGSATIYATSDNNIEATATVSVVEVQDPYELMSLSINPGTYSLNVGDTYSLSAVKNPTTATNVLTWSSSDTSIVTVDSSGLITGISEGTATITLTSDNNLTASATITVAGSQVVGELTDFEIVPSTLTMTAGETVTLSINKTPSNANSTFYYNSWNTAVATVDSSGVVTAVSNGTATIAIYSDNGIQKQMTVRVISIIDPSDVALTMSCTGGWGTTCQFDLEMTNNNLSAFTDGIIEFGLPEGSSMVCWSGTLDSNNVLSISGDYEPSGTYHFYGQITFPEGTSIEDGMSQVTYSFVSGE